MTVSKAADRSSNISNEDLEAILASLRSSTTESKAVSVEFPLHKKLVTVQEVVLCEKGSDLVEHNYRIWIHSSHKGMDMAATILR